MLLTLKKDAVYVTMPTCLLSAQPYLVGDFGCGLLMLAWNIVVIVFSAVDITENLLPGLFCY